jgi:lipopolysaccharide export system protein LptC
MFGLKGLELGNSEHRMSRAATMRRPAAPAPALRAVDEHDRGHEFRSAKRHSRRVRLLRWVLPTAALIGLAIVMFFLWFDPLRFYRGLPVEFGRISITDNKLTIEAPKLSGFTQDRRPYLVTAESAAQDLTSPNRIELTGISGHVELANRGETKLSAQTGLYDMKAGLLQLGSGIEIGATGGYKMQLRDATMNVRKGSVVTKRPVTALFPDGSLLAKNLEIQEHGDFVKFGGGVTMSFKLPREDANAAGAKTADSK